MIGMKVDINNAKNFFFDREAVIKAIGRAKAKAFKQAGAIVRRTAQRSIKMGEKSAPAGQPPHGHKSGRKTRRSKSTGKVRISSVSLLREFIYFVYEPSSGTVVIGPAKLSGTFAPEALSALEYGGTSKVISRGKTITVTIKPHPFMEPARRATDAETTRLWEDSIRP